MERTGETLSHVKMLPRFVYQGKDTVYFYV
jgi:hypothetical protein